MATFSLGFIDQAGKVKFFGEKFQVTFNSKDNSDTVSNSSKSSRPQLGNIEDTNPSVKLPTKDLPPTPQKPANPYAEFMNKEISMDDYNERLINDIGEQLITEPEYDNLIALLDKDNANYDLNLKLLRDGNTVE